MNVYHRIFQTFECTKLSCVGFLTSCNYCSVGRSITIYYTYILGIYTKISQGFKGSNSIMVLKKLLVGSLLLLGAHSQAAEPLPKKELEALAHTVYFEARGASKRDKYLVAGVVINRSAHKAFPHSINAVISQKKPIRQFEFTKNKRRKIDTRSKEYQDSLKAARKALRVPANPNSVLYFHDRTYGRRFTWAKPLIAKKSFIFYGEK